ncbi:MAG: NADP-dependent phosphogluconate dehydrogenase [Bacilli bacterium]|nr:NADP-dependent phosphogluconate dehydrogenase [Bacilli bacterium]
MIKNDIGIIGLSVMGRSLALNMANHGFEVGGYNRSYEVTQHMEKTWPHDHFHGYQTIEEFLDSLTSPKKIMLMIKAGSAIDGVIDQLLPYLEKDDIILDGGNSYFQDTIRRELTLKEKGIYYFGVGVSGGEEGARFGPSIMPGGNHKAYEQIRPILESIAAHAKDGAVCCTYIGENGAGHYVKMVHNGIEYADMQIIAEAYLILKYIGHLDNQEISHVFKEYNKGELESFLIEITGNILAEKDDETEGYLVDMIRDSSQQKGTGKWTSEEAMHLGVNVSMITSSYLARVMSNNENKKEANLRFHLTNISTNVDKEVLIQQVQEGMYAAKIIAYAQGFDLLREAAKQYQWKLSFEKIASILRAGCIIRADFLNDMMRAYKENPNLSHLLLNDYFSNTIYKYQESLRKLNATAILQGIPVPSLNSAISYLDMLSSPYVGANLIQAQRDYFGAHTFERVDKKGAVHHQWGDYHA